MQFLGFMLNMVAITKIGIELLRIGVIKPYIMVSHR